MSTRLVPYLATLVCFLHVAAELIRGTLQHHYATRHGQRVTLTTTGRRQPSVDVLVPCYNEDPELLETCLTSLVEQDYQGRLRFFVIDDGSRNQAKLRPVLRLYEHRPEWKVLLLDVNVGKRRAMDAGLWLGDGDVVVVVDSDTALEPDAISQIVVPFADARVGGVSANNRALNAEANLLTRLINRSYGMLFERERAAQSHFRTILCCHGAFAAYRRTALEAVWNHHVAGYKTGEDLHLTLRLLQADYDTVLQQRAVARTHVPDTLDRYARQQRRWSRSFIRDFFLALRVIARRPRPRAYLIFDLIVQAGSPILLAAGALLCLVQVVLFGLGWLPWGLGLIVATTFITSQAAAVQARSLPYLLYGLVYYGVVLPGYLLGLVSFGRDSWKTRNLVPKRVPVLPH